MVEIAHKDQIINKLHDIYKAKGFIAEEEALSVFYVYKLRLNEIDSICEQLLSMGVLIRPVQEDIEDNSNEYDRSQIDYNALFNEVIKIAPNLSYFISYIKCIQPPQHREWRNLMHQAQNGNRYAYRRLYEMYLRVVIKISLSYHKKYGLDLEDTIQDGCIGLMIAIEKFNQTEHELFTTYAPWWIRQVIDREKPFTPSPLLYFPVHILGKLYFIYDIVTSHDCNFCVEENICPQLVSSVERKLECSVTFAECCIEYFRGFKSIEEALESGDGEAFTDHHEFEDMLTSQISLCQLEYQMGIIIGALPAKEQKVLLLRYGIPDDHEQTLEEIGTLMGLTRERIRQIEAKAFRRCHHPSRFRILKEYI